MRNERYYFRQMSDGEKEIYRVIWSALKERRDAVELRASLPRDRVQEIYLRVLFDTPLFFYVNQTVIRMAGAPGMYVLLPEYLYGPAEIGSITREIRSVVDRIGRTASAFADDPFRLEKCLHDSVVKSVAYDYDSLMKSDCFNAHSIVGAFLEKKAVCEGIAKAFKLLCNEYGLKCIVVVGKADPKLEFGDDTYHAWNVIKIGGASYHVDATWDNMYHDGLRHISYDYFNVPTADICRDHHPIVEIPPCSSNALNYFECTNSYVSDMDGLVRFVSDRYRDASITFRIRQPSNDLSTAEDVLVRCGVALAVASKRHGYDRRFAFFYNDRMDIVKILFDPA